MPGPTKAVTSKGKTKFVYSREFAKNPIICEVEPIPVGFPWFTVEEHKHEIPNHAQSIAALVLRLFLLRTACLQSLWTNNEKSRHAISEWLVSKYKMSNQLASIQIYAVETFTLLLGKIWWDLRSYLDATCKLPWLSELIILRAHWNKLKSRWLLLIQKLISLYMKEYEGSPNE